MTPYRVNAALEKKSERIEKCAGRQLALQKMDGAAANTCADCGSAFWMHPIYGRSLRCCSCRVAHMTKMQEKRTDSYVPKPGFPKPLQFQEMAEIVEYIGHNKLTCLECGHDFRGLQQHINHMHLMSANDYKIKFGIPLGVGLVGCETKDALRVYMTGVNANLTPEELAERVKKMHSFHPKNGGIVSTQPAIKKIRKSVAKKMSESDNHLSKTVNGTTIAPCSQCGISYEVSTWSAVTNPCRIKCKDCKREKNNEYKKDWNKKNSESLSKYGKSYREKLKEQGVLQDFDKRKNLAKTARLTT